MQSKINQGSRNTMYLWMTVGLISLGQFTGVDAERLNRSDVSDQNVDSLAGYGDSKPITNNWYSPSGEDYGSGNSYINDAGDYEVYEDFLESDNTGRIERRDPKSTRGRGTRVKSTGGNRSTGGTKSNGGKSVGNTKGTGKGTGTMANKPGTGNGYVDNSSKNKPVTRPQTPAVNPTNVQDHSMSTPVRDLDSETVDTKPKTFTEKVKGYGKDATDVLDTIDQINNHPVTQGIKDSILGNPEEITDPIYSGSADEPISEGEPETQVQDTEVPEVGPETQVQDTEVPGVGAEPGIQETESLDAGTESNDANMEGMSY